MDAEKQDLTLAPPKARVAETFVSLQGELPLLGTPMMFVRFHGCNRNCSWCDEPQALNYSGAYYTTTVPLLVEKVLGAAALDRVYYWWMTGGEPTIQHRFVAAFTAALRSVSPLPVGMDTNGDLLSSVAAPLLDLLDTVIVSPKFPAGMEGADGWDARVDGLLDVAKRSNVWVRLVVDPPMLALFERCPASLARLSGAANPVFLSPCHGTPVTWRDCLRILPPFARVSFQAHKYMGFQ